MELQEDVRLQLFDRASGENAKNQNLPAYWRWPIPSLWLSVNQLYRPVVTKPSTCAPGVISRAESTLLRWLDAAPPGTNVKIGGSRTTSSGSQVSDPTKWPASPVLLWHQPLLPSAFQCQWKFSLAELASSLISQFALCLCLIAVDVYYWTGDPLRWHGHSLCGFHYSWPSSGKVFPQHLFIIRTKQLRLILILS